MTTWRAPAPTRDITIHKGEDITITGKFTRDKQPWIPPEGTEAYFVVYRPTTNLTLPCVIIDDKFSTHIEESVADTIPNKADFWFYVRTPDTPDGNPKCITTGVVKRKDPK